MSLKYLIDLVGSDRVVVGTDNMGGQGGQQGGQGGPNVAVPGGPVAGPKSVLDQLELSQADRDFILFGNAKRLFKL